MNSKQLGIAVLVLSSLAGGAVLAEDGVADTSIVFGQVAALTGPAQDLGQGMRQGIVAAFAAANRDNGVFGRTLKLVSRDDGYEPEKTVEETKAILNEDKVFALVGAVGTPTSKAGQPIARDAKVPFIGPFTGAEFLRNPYNRYVVNVRASYFEETEAWIDHLTKDLGISKIAILYQDDAFGLAGLDGVQQAMARRNMTLVASGSFRRNTTAVKSALLDIMKAQPEAVVTVAPYKPVAGFIKLAHQVQMNAVFVAISFVGSDSLAQELGKEGAGVIVSQVVPSPWDESLPVVASYHQAITAVVQMPSPASSAWKGT
jgi:ABC-type branched-subunit amino acid transport system substrate-binding protein